MFHSIMTNSVREEACFHAAYHPPVEGPLRLKIENGAGGNTLLLRTFKQMFGGQAVYHPACRAENKTRFLQRRQDPLPWISVPGHETRRQCGIHSKFYVVDENGPAIWGLPTLEKTRLVQINLSTIETPPQSGTERTACQMTQGPRDRPRMTKHFTRHPSPESPKGLRITGSPVQQRTTEPPHQKFTGIDSLRQHFPDCFHDIGCYTSRLTQDRSSTRRADGPYILRRESEQHSTAWSSLVSSNLSTTTPTGNSR